MTTVGTLKNYRYDLNRSNNTMTKAMNMVINQRLFNSYAEDPALATRCFQIRRSYTRAESQLKVNDSLRHKYDVAWEALDNCADDLYSIASASDTGWDNVIRSLSDPIGSGRIALGQSLESKAKDLVQIMNARYGENYVFSGADTLNPPFTWEPQKNPDYIDVKTIQAKLDAGGLTAEEEKELQAKIDSTFQYIAPGNVLTNDVNEAEIVAKVNPDADLTQPNMAGNEWYLGPDGEPVVDAKDAELIPRENPTYKETAAYKYLKSDGTGTNEQSMAKTVLCYRGVPVDSMEDADKAKMEYFLNEAKNVDVGLGHKEEGGDAVTSTVFNSALQGIHYLGGEDSFGTKTVMAEIKDPDTGAIVKSGEVEIPNNIISVVKEMGEILQRCDTEDGRWSSEEDQLRFQALVNEYEDATSTFRERWSGELDTQTGFLRDNTELLTETADNLAQQYSELEYADPAAAISNYMFARYAYDTALKVGNSILSQSLMDYLNL